MQAFKESSSKDVVLERRFSKNIFRRIIFLGS
jgi:hypothetical protein